MTAESRPIPSTPEEHLAEAARLLDAALISFGDDSYHAADENSAANRQAAAIHVDLANSLIDLAKLRAVASG